MGWVTGFVVYALIWWTVLFTVLPVGTRPVDAEAASGGWRGAPANPHLVRKAIATTVLATLLWAVAYLLISSPWISFRASALLMPDT